MLCTTGHLNAFEMLTVTSAVTAENDHRFTGILSRSPQPIALMIADGFWQSILGTEEINRAGLAVTVRKDCCPGTLLGRKIVVNFRDLAGHFLPSELICEVLRKGSGPLVFCPWRFETEHPLILNIRRWRQDWGGQRS